MLQAFFHAWERRLASVTTDRVVRPFEWGLDWIPPNGHRRTSAPRARLLRDWVSQVMADTDAFFTPPPTSDYHAAAATPTASACSTFPSALTTPHRDEQHRLLPLLSGAREPSAARPRAAVLVLPQWNADAGGHVGLCRLLAWNGMSALRLSLPYHDQRMPPELHRADYIVSANVARTVQVCRQAVLDARRAIAWLARAGLRAHRHPRHEPRLVPGAADDGARAADPGGGAQSHLAVLRRRRLARPLHRHVREGLDGHIDLELLRALWKPISPRLVSRSRCATGGRCSSTRGTT